MILQTWGGVLAQSFRDLGFGVVSFLPNLLIAIIIFLAGWVVGSLLGRVVEKVIDTIKVDNALRSAGVETVLHKAGLHLHSGRFVGMLIEWFIIVVFLIASFDVLGLTQVNIFLQQVVLLYLPQVIVAVLILLVAGVVAQVMQRIVSSAAAAGGVSSANFLGSFTKWAIWIFALLTALYQLGIAAPFVQTLFTGVVVAVSVAAGLAFGLGGQDAASRFIESVRKETSERQ
jgi:small-conductance mechanosensitive channel